MEEKAKNSESIKAIDAQVVFKTAAGKTLYTALMEFTGADCDIVPRDGTGAIDPLNVMYNQGRRSVVIYIDKLLNMKTNKERQERAGL